MRTIFRRGVVALALLLAAVQFVGPARSNPVIDPTRALTASTDVPDHVARVFDRACRDCHSNQTRWPWYSHLAPVSWFVIDHVNHGRSHFNYSDWTRYPPDEAARLLQQSCKLVKEQSMPLRSYTMMHRDARLSPTDVEALCAWSKPAVSPEEQR
jgi:Haem-binding domain